MTFKFIGVAGVSPKMQEVLRLLKLVAPTEATVLLLGETGTGKGLAARAIHLNSPRAAGPFVVVNCAAIPETLMESELFGHERGAFTGAVARKDGRFLLAHRGSVFLDEIGELSLTTQAKILRVLQDREIEPVGGARTLKVDVRIIAATNRDLEIMVQDRQFREDMYFRLNVFPIRLPRLRERLEDLPRLAGHFIKIFAEKNHKNIKDLTPEALELFRRYSWPGNIRELENVMERGVIVAQGEWLTAAELPPGMQPGVESTTADTEDSGFAPEPDLPALERRLISRTLDKVAWSRREAAEILGISLEELNLKIRFYRLEDRTPS